MSRELYYFMSKLMNEGICKKGGVNANPVTPHPPAPKGQGGQGFVAYECVGDILTGQCLCSSCDKDLILQAPRNGKFLGSGSHISYCKVCNAGMVYWTLNNDVDSDLVFLRLCIEHNKSVFNSIKYQPEEE